MVIPHGHCHRIQETHGDPIFLRIHETHVLSCAPDSGCPGPGVTGRLEGGGSAAA
jgi:hypothetical protein